MNLNLMMAQPVSVKQILPKKPGQDQIPCPIYQKPVPVPVIAGAGFSFA